MSRIGKLLIKIPEGVEVNFTDLEINVKGKFGHLKKTLPDLISLKLDKNLLEVNLKNKTKKIQALHGLYRTLIYNMVLGVSQQFHVTLILKGVGYRASIQNNKIILNLGYSHPVNITIPEDITVNIDQNTIINLKSCDKEKLGLFASNIRSWRKPEPYKGKGILYKDEKIIRKAGKTGK